MDWWFVAPSPDSLAQNFLHYEKEKEKKKKIRQSKTFKILVNETIVFFSSESFIAASPLPLPPLPPLLSLLLRSLDTSLTPEG